MNSLIPVGNTQDPGVEALSLLVPAVDGSPGDEGGSGPDRGGGDSQPGDIDANPEDAPALEDEPEDRDEVDILWRKLGLQPDRGQVDVVKSNWLKIEGQIDLVYLNLRQVIIDSPHGRISKEEQDLKEEMKLLTHMSLLTLRRAELLLSFDIEVDLRAEY